MCCSLVPLNSVNIYGEQNVWQDGNKMILLHCRRCHFSLHHSQHCHHSFACNLMIDWVNWQWQRFAEMHFYPPPLLLYCDTKITSCLAPRYCQMPAFENALGNSHLIIFRVTVMITFQDPHWSLQLLPWDRRPFGPQKANVNFQPSDPDEILQVNQLIPCQLTKVQKN